MNSGNSKLAQSYYPLVIKPSADLKFSHFLSNPLTKAAFSLVEIAQFVHVQDATWRKKLKHLYANLVSIRLENVDIGFSLHYCLEEWRNMIIQLIMSWLTSKSRECTCWKLPLPT